MNRRDFIRLLPLLAIAPQAIAATSVPEPEFIPRHFIPSEEWQQAPYELYYLNFKPMAGERILQRFYYDGCAKWYQATGMRFVMTDDGLFREVKP